jgi:hypothetical protein
LGDKLALEERLLTEEYKMLRARMADDAVRGAF